VRGERVLGWRGGLRVLMRLMMYDDFVCTSILSFLFFGVGVKGWLEPILYTLTTL
jgi:hypothetical protein